MAFDWDDLRIFLAVTRSGSLAIAARGLGIDASTVGRRTQRLETALKSTLFVRSKAGLELTAAGARLQELALDVEMATDAAAEVSGGEVVGGTVRLSVSEGFGTRIIAPALVSLRRKHGRLNVELAANAGFLSPSRREVDMAVTLSAPSDARLVVSPLIEYQLALYGAPAYLKRHGAPSTAADLANFDLVGYVDDLIYAPELRYLQQVHPSLRPGLSSSSIRAQREIIASGAGLGILPCFLGRDLVRVLPGEVLIGRRFWLSIHRDVAATARVRAVVSWIRALVAANAAILAPYR